MRRTLRQTPLALTAALAIGIAGAPFAVAAGVFLWVIYGELPAIDGSLLALSDALGHIDILAIALFGRPG